MDYVNLNSAILAWLQTSGLKIAAIIILGIVAQFLIAKTSKSILSATINKHFAAKDRSDTGKEKRINTINQVMTKTTGIILFLIILLMVFIELGINVTPILTGAGIVGIAVGFGAQDMVKNLFHGIFILVEDQYSEGDVVTLSGITGTVEDFDLRKTILRDLDGTQHHIPNGEITIASNRTKGWSGINLNIGVAYSTDLKKLKQIVDELGQELAKKDSVVKAPELVGVEEFADSAIVVKILGRTKPGSQWEVTREFRQLLKDKFEDENIEIPYPHQVEIQKSA